MSDPHFTRREILWLWPASGACLSLLSAPAAPKALAPRLSDGKIQVAAPELRFVAGPALVRLQNGAPAPFAIQLAVSVDHFSTIAQRDIERFVFSYDLWEEKFAVTRLGAPRRSVSHLAPRAAEAWCLEEMAVNPPVIPPEQAFWLRLDVRAENPREEGAVSEGDGMSLTRLVELFSRRSRGEQNRWSVEAGPFRMAELARSPRTGVDR